MRNLAIVMLLTLCGCVSNLDRTAHDMRQQAVGASLVFAQEIKGFAGSHGELRAALKDANTKLRDAVWDAWVAGKRGPDGRLYSLSAGKTVPLSAEDLAAAIAVRDADTARVYAIDAGYAFRERMLMDSADVFARAQAALGQDETLLLNKRAELEAAFNGLIHASAAAAATVGVWPGAIP